MSPNMCNLCPRSIHPPEGAIPRWTRPTDGFSIDPNPDPLLKELRPLYTPPNRAGHAQGRQRGFATIYTPFFISLLELVREYSMFVRVRTLTSGALPQRELLDLSGGGLGKRTEYYRAGHFEVRHT